MEIDKKLKVLPLTKSNPNTLMSLFGTTDIVPMWVADMEFEIAKPIQDTLIQRISNSGFGYEYKPESFFLAQKDWCKNKYQIDLNREHIIYSPSIITSISVLIENLTSDNDGIIIQPPVFMEFRDVIRKGKRKIIKNPLKLIDGHYEIDFENLEEKGKSENNKILILCNPHNPVGRAWKEEEIENIISICKKNNLILISDEIHKDIILFDNQFNSVLHYFKKWEKMIVCTSEAKTFNLCGISDSMMFIPDENLRNLIKPTFNKYALGRTNALTRIALETAYKKGGLWLKELIKTIENNVNSIEKELIDSKINLIIPEATFQVWLDFRSLFKDSKEMFRHITEHSGIAINAGHWFGREGALFIRMNIATSNEKVIASIKKIKKSISET